MPCRPHSITTDVRLGRRDAELDEADLGLVDARGAAEAAALLVEQHAVDQLRILNDAAQLLHYLNVLWWEIKGGMETGEAMVSS